LYWRWLVALRAANYESFFSQYMRAAIEIEMENRGYTKSDNPDLLINFNGIMQEKTQVRTTSTPPPMHGGYYGYRGGYYNTWGGYGYSTQTHVSQYTEEGVSESSGEPRGRRNEGCAKVFRILSVSCR